MAGRALIRKGIVARWCVFRYREKPDKEYIYGRRSSEKVLHELCEVLKTQLEQRRILGFTVEYFVDGYLITWR
jgi:hypothetical protein